MLNLIGHLLYLLLTAALAFSLPDILWNPQTKQFLFVIGALAIWRYGWAALNWIRFLLFRHIAFPRWRRQADQIPTAQLPSEVYLLVTSFRIGAETTRRVYHSVFAEAIRYGKPVTIVASVVERGDEIFIKQLFHHYAPPPHITLVFTRIAGSGKRDALACGFRAIARQTPASDAVVAVVDGDSLLENDLLRRCGAFFPLMPKMAALTTDENCEVEGNWLFTQWYNVRFAQRNIYMGSCSLSKRVLTLTGRMSMFRASVVTDPTFIERVELDWIDHWRFGRFKFLTGDDKSSWYHILRSGQQMIYVPDVTVTTIETPPTPHFIESSLMLMRRWVGNMLRTNHRAIMLGPKPMGWFPWLAILDQRISMWTSLTSPAIAILATLFITPAAFLYYLLWMAITRYILTLSLLISRPTVTAFYPFLIYYNQVVGSFVKTLVLFRLDKQKWTRQQTRLHFNRSAWKERWLNRSSAAMQCLAYFIFLTALASLSGILPVPDANFWYEKLFS